MLPISTKEPVRFVPEHYQGKDDAPVYLIEVPTEFRKAELNRDIRVTGGEPISDAQMLETLRDCIRDIVAKDQHDELIGLIDELEAQQADGKVDIELAKDVDAIEKDIARNHPRYREAIAARAFWMELSPLCAARLFLIGREGDAPFARDYGRLAEGVLEGLPHRDVVAIGWHVFTLTHLSKEQEKNSGLPSKSSGGQKTSPSAGSRRTAAAGKSAAKNTRKTRAIH